MEDYWKRDPFLQYAPIADGISRQRFRDLFRFLHFSDNQTLVPRGVDGHDRLGRVSRNGYFSKFEIYAGKEGVVAAGTSRNLPVVWRGKTIGCV